jgi:hypothetical protein
MKGWFKDSWRHMLAAKGIKTRHFVFKHEGKIYPDLVHVPYSLEGKREKIEINKNISPKDRDAVIHALETYEKIRPGIIKEMADKKVAYEHDESGASEFETSAQYGRTNKSQIPFISLKYAHMPGSESSFFHEYAHFREDEARRKKGLPSIFDESTGNWKEIEGKPSDSKEWTWDDLITKHEPLGAEKRAVHFTERMKKQIYKRGVPVTEAVGSTGAMKLSKELQKEKLQKATENMSKEEKDVFKAMKYQVKKKIRNEDDYQDDEPSGDKWISPRKRHQWGL